jgi:hypothetical protein
MRNDQNRELSMGRGVRAEGGDKGWCKRGVPTYLERGRNL